MDKGLWKLIFRVLRQIPLPQIFTFMIVKLTSLTPSLELKDFYFVLDLPNKSMSFHTIFCLLSTHFNSGFSQLVRHMNDILLYIKQDKNSTSKNYNEGQLHKKITRTPQQKSQGNG